MASIQNSTRISRKSEMHSCRLSACALACVTWRAQWQQEYLRTSLIFSLTRSVRSATSESNKNDEGKLQILNFSFNFMIRKQDCARKVLWTDSLHDILMLVFGMSKFEGDGSNMKSGNDAWYQSTRSSLI